MQPIQHLMTNIYDSYFTITAHVYGSDVVYRPNENTSEEEFAKDANVKTSDKSSYWVFLLLRKSC